MKAYWQWGILAISTWLCTTEIATSQVTVGTLADELGNRDRLATHPDGSYTQHQASSHDPRNALGESDLGAPWGFLNVDFGNFIRQETIEGRQEWVLLEDDGPGVVTRWWATGTINPTGNRFRVYVDGDLSNPVLSGTVNELVGGDNSGFGGSLNFATPNVGGNLYGPIPYSSGVKITWDGTSPHGPAGADGAPPTPTHNTSDALWYSINYRKLAPGTNVTGFSAADTTTYQSNLNAVNGRLANPTVTGSVTDQHSVEDAEVEHGSALLHSLNGTGAIRRIMLNVSGADQVAALEEAFVELRFDGQLTARVPAGQFFGNGTSKSQANPLNEGGNYMQTVAANGDLTSYWVMPYQTSAEVRIVNRSNQTLNVDLEVDSGDWTWDANSMHFHANYKTESDIKTGGASNSYSTSSGDADFRFLNVRGKGVFVGDTLSIRNQSLGGGNNWWGEGDEKIYVDYLDGNGEGHNSVPVHLGTGTEDYYGYSFGSGTLFGSPFVNQPIADGQGPGGPTVNSRVRGLDAIPFSESFKFDMEVWKWLDGEVDFDVATFWYGRPGAVALSTVADLGLDFRAGLNAGDPAAGIADTTGEGTWQYLASDNADPGAVGANLQTLTWGDVGNAGNQGFGGGENGSNNLAAISSEFLFVDGGVNLGIQGSPGYHELALHPGGDNFEGNAVRDYVVAQWTAGESIDGLINVSGSIRNFIDTGDSVEFFIYVNGVLEFSADAAGATLDETPFDFDSQIAPGQTVDFVLGNGGAGNPFGDETALRAIIAADFSPLPPLFGDLDGDGSLGVGDWMILRDNFDTAVGDLDGDGVNNVVDFGLFKDAYINANGSQAFQALLSVPEPSTFVIGGTMLTLSASIRCFRNDIPKEQ